MRCHLAKSNNMPPISIYMGNKSEMVQCQTNVLIGEGPHSGG